MKRKEMNSIVIFVVLMPVLQMNAAKVGRFSCKKDVWFVDGKHKKLGNLPLLINSVLAL